MVDPWQGLREGSQAVNNALDSIEQNRRARLLSQAQLQQMQQGLMERQAANRALVDTYGTGDRPDAESQLASALALQAQEQKMLAAQDRMGKFVTTVDNYKKAGATPEFLTELTKLEMSKDPAYAKIAPSVNYMDGEKLIIEKDFKDNELKDPMTGQFLPAGRYTVEGKRTGDLKNPFNFSSIKPSTKAKITEVGVGGNMMQKAVTDGSGNVIQYIGQPYKKGALVDVNMTQEKEESKKVGGFFGEDFGKMQENSRTARKQSNQLDAITNLLGGIETGKLTPTTTTIAQYSNAFGFKIDPNLPAKEAAQSFMGQFALMLRNPAGGAGMPGNLSDSDRNFLVQTISPSLAQTPQGRGKLIGTMKKLNERAIEEARLAREYRQKHGQIDEGFYDELDQWSETHPLFTSNKQADTGNAVVSKPQGKKPLSQY